jgi:hypothetical protein
MPGGHMTYLGLLTKVLLKQVPINTNFITVSGSAHGSNSYFPSEIGYKFSVNEWDNWHQHALVNYTTDNICVIKDGWGHYSLDNWEKKLNSLDNTICILASPVTKLDWYYCWFNMVSKIPKHVYTHLKYKSPLFPKIWHVLPKKHRIKGLTLAMPIHPLDETMNLSIPFYRFAATELLDITFPKKIYLFLKQRGYDVELTPEVLTFHANFVSHQQTSLRLATDLVNSIKWPSRGPFDEILFEWIDTNPWAELE